MRSLMTSLDCTDATTLMIPVPLQKRMLDTLQRPLLPTSKRSIKVISSPILYLGTLPHR